MTDEVQQPDTTNKLAVGLGAGTAGALATQVLAWLVKTVWNVDIPVEIQLAIASLLTGVPAVLAAHFTAINKPA